ncbi:SGS-domain-containing protein [Polyplosphaeria fusca]|uniref:SGS-domain-containing protein n=1 Tax=Polyplosphaeria fusca TaxID=682080 RepID=A0A9P4UYN0_9PLEO|nr:SGS-domain-containing protein [Polyplosphaeria fusca]
MDLAARGAAALKESKYDEAIKHYTAALSSNPSAAPYYIQRSTAYQRLSRYTEALADAEIAVVLAVKRAKRELIKDAQLRRGIALFFVERYADAEFVLAIVKKLDEKEKTLTIWTMKVAAKLKTLPEGDERGNVTVKEVPDVELPSESSSKTTKVTSAESASEPAARTPPAPTPANKIKHDWYQTNENVYFTLLAKGVPKEKTTVEIDQDSLSISFPIENSSDFSYSLDPFYAQVNPSDSAFRITPSKIEVTLRKAAPGVKWHALEGDRDTTSTEPKPSIPTEVLTGKTSEEKAPAYPTSSRRGPQNWDQIGDEEEGDDDGGDETNKFFKQLYKGASADAQRAMMKSYQESGGTVLSTDWSNVGNRTVVPEPPDGMEAKKY